MPENHQKEKKVLLSAEHLYKEFPVEESRTKDVVHAVTDINLEIREGETLALNPRLIVCDEPVSALDVSIQSQVLNLLKDLQEQYGLTYLFISHDLSVVKFISDRVCVMFLGMICEIGDTEEIYAKPLHPYTRFLLNAIPLADPKLRSEKKELLQGDIPSPVHPPTGCRFHTRCPYAKDICASEVPPCRQVGDRIVYCHFPLEEDA